MRRTGLSKAGVALAALLCGGLLAYAFAAEAQTVRIVSQRAKGDLPSLDDGAGLPNLIDWNGRPAKLGFEYHSWRVLGADLWTWGGEYRLLTPHDATLKLSEGGDIQKVAKNYHIPFPDETPFEYRFPLGWFVFGPVLVLAALAAGGAMLRAVPRAARGRT